MGSANCTSEIEPILDYYYGDYNWCNLSYFYFDTGVANIIFKCNTSFSSSIWLCIKSLILMTALPGNVILIWFFLSGWMGTSTSKKLGLNLCLLNVLYCLCLPLDIYMTFYRVSDATHSTAESLSCLNLVGCPLLLTCMCVERYVAVGWPVTYMQMNKSIFHVTCSCLAWVLMLVIGTVVFFHDIRTLAWCVGVGISVLYVLMLLCLVGIIRVLRKKSPGDNELDRVSLKRKALKNVVTVLMPFTVAYLPILGLIPLMSLITVREQPMDKTSCLIFQAIICFPNLGLYIGPLFYLSYIQKLIICLKTQNHMQGAATENSVIP